MDYFAKNPAARRILLKKLDELPILPRVLSRLMTLRPNADDAFDQLLELLEDDPTFATRVLRYANSVSFRGSEEITSLRVALARMGTRQVHELLMSATITRVFVPQTAGQRNLWVHAVQTAIGARWIATEARRDRPRAQTAYLAGLLHDIGRFLMVREMDEDVEYIDELEREGPLGLLVRERATNGYDHAQLGGRACAAWNLPKEICLSIRDHHRRGTLPEDPEVPGLRKLTSVVAMADVLSNLLSGPYALADQTGREQEELLERYCAGIGYEGLEPHELRSAIEPLLAESRASARALGLSG